MSGNGMAERFGRIRFDAHSGRREDCSDTVRGLVTRKRSAAGQVSFVAGLAAALKLGISGGSSVRRESSSSTTVRVRWVMLVVLAVVAAMPAAANGYVL